MECSPAREKGASFVRLLGAAWLLIAVIVGLADLLFILRHYVTFPFGDQWLWLGRWYKWGALRTLYAQFNEHRLTVPGLFFFLDHRYFGARNTFLILVSLFFQTGCAAILAIPVWRRPDVPRPVAYVFCGFVIVTLLWFIQGEDLFYPYQLQVSCANFGILAALHLFARLAGRQPPHGRSGTRLWIAVFGCALWSTFSFGHGMLVWPVLLAIGGVAKLPRRQLLIILLVLLVAVGIYFASWQPPAGAAKPLASLHHPVRIAHYAVVLLGLPFFGAGGQDVRLASHVGSYAITIAGIGLAVAAILRFAIAKPGRRSPEQVFYCSMLLVNLGAALLAALGRSSFPIEQALSGRYAPMPLIFWVSLAALVTIDLSQTRGSPVRALWCVLLIAASAATLPTHIAIGRYMANRERDQAAAAISIAVGVPDRPRIAADLATLDLVTYVDQNVVRSLGHSLFARPESPWLATPLGDHFQFAPLDSCTGSLDTAESLPEPHRGARLVGWAWDSRRQQPAVRIWIADSQKIVRGFGITRRSRPDVAAALGNPALESAGWIAYARSSPSGPSYTAYVELADGKSVCQIGSPRSPAP